MTDDDDLRDEIDLLKTLIHALQADAERYRWLRDGNGYYPEENFLRGGQELDDAVDAEMEKDRGPQANGQGAAS